MKDKLQKIAALKINTNELQLKQFNSKSWLVGSTVMAKETVMNGIFYSGDVLKHSQTAWNGRPVVLDHPQNEDGYISANSPDVLDKSGVGMLFNSFVDNDTKLKAEVWLDVERLSMFPSVTTAISNGKMLEVSTGLMLDLEEKEGTYNGKDYTYVAHNLNPDHLALLPDSIGAFSVKEGAGFPRVNQQMVANILETWDKRLLLRKALVDQGVYKEFAFWIDEVYDEFIIVYVESTAVTEKVEYTINEENGVVTLKKPLAVFKRIEYIPIQEGDNMASNKKTKKNDEVQTNAEVEVEVTPTAVEEVPVDPIEGAPAAEIEANAEQEAPAVEVDPKLEEMKAVYAAHRSKLVSVIKANKNATFSDEDFEGMSVNMLESISKLCEAQIPADHKGLGGPGGLAANKTKTETPYVGE